MKRLPPKTGKREEAINILLVDGNSLFKRGYTGAKSEYNKKGEYIGGIFYFMTTLKTLLESKPFNRVYVFWDGKLSGKLRWEIYADYKKDRGKDYLNGNYTQDENEVLQRIQIKRYLEELFIRQMEDEVVEADDLIAYVCKSKRPNEQMTVVTSDRDLCQLVDDDIFIYIPDFRATITPKNYQSYFNHHYENAALVKILCGDSADSIKGVKGLGESTLLKYFPEIAERKVTIVELVAKAVAIQNEREMRKKRRLKVLDNIIGGVTDGIQGNDVYRINEQLIRLEAPLVTKSAVRRLNHLMDSDIDPTDRGLKNAYQLMKEDGMADRINNWSIEYLMPFKKLILRESKIN